MDVKCIFWSVLLFLTHGIQYTSCDHDTINIVPTPDSPCPGRAGGEVCLTLDQFNANFTFQSISELTLELHPGNHHMNSRFNSYSTNNFTMRAKSTASVLCTKQLQLTNNSYCFLFGLQHALISGITFVGSTMYINSGDNVTFERSSFTNRRIKTPCPITPCYPGILITNFYVTTLVITQCTFADNKEGYGGLYSRGDSVTVEGSTFANNDGSAIYHSGKEIHILNSNFIGNGVAAGRAGAVYARTVYGVAIANSYFSDNEAGDLSGAVHVEAAILNGGQVNISYSYFNDNVVRN